MTDIYDQHNKAFARVSAFVILKNGERVATIAFKFPADGAGRLWCYVHWLGWPMVRGYADGYGYDKRSAAVANAVNKMAVMPASPDQARDMKRDGQPAFEAALAKDDGHGWERHLRDAGFAVFQAV